MNDFENAETESVYRLKGRRARKKGHDFERWVAGKLKSIYPKARRHLEFHTVDAKEGRDLQDTGPFWIQCKKLKAYAPVTTIEQVHCDEARGDIPVVVTAGDNQRPMVVLPFDQFMKLVQAYEAFHNLDDL